MCDYSSTQKETLQGHIDATHNNKMISICLRKDILQMTLFLKAKENQINKSDLDGSRLKRKLDKYNCQICDFVERKKVKLINHMSNVHNETSFYCEHCGQKYKNRNDMKKHVLEVHEGKGFPCAQWKDKLNVHKHFTANIYLREMKLPCQYFSTVPLSCLFTRCDSNFAEEYISRCSLARFNPLSQSHEETDPNFNTQISFDFDKNQVMYITSHKDVLSIHPVLFIGTWLDHLGTNGGDSMEIEQNQD